MQPADLFAKRATVTFDISARENKPALYEADLNAITRHKYLPQVPETIVDRCSPRDEIYTYINARATLSARLKIVGRG